MRFIAPHLQARGPQEGDGGRPVLSPAAGLPVAIYCIGNSLPDMSHAVNNSVVLCGLPGDVEHADDPKNYRNAKVGGQPVLPGQNPPEYLSHGGTVCRNCGKSLVLVAQVLQPALDVSYHTEAT